MWSGTEAAVSQSKERTDPVLLKRAQTIDSLGANGANLIPVPPSMRRPVHREWAAQHEQLEIIASVNQFASLLRWKAAKVAGGMPHRPNRVCLKHCSSA
jgi:hypothetical protein